MSRPSEILMDIKSVKAWLTEADYMPVVRCKDCKYYLNDMGHCLNDLINAWMIVNPNWYCANAVRKDYDD